MLPTERIVKTILSMVGIMGVGIGLWTVVTPNESQLKELPRSSPSHRAEQQRLNAEVMAMIKEAARTNENVTQRTWPWKK